MDLNSLKPLLKKYAIALKVIKHVLAGSVYLVPSGYGYQEVIVEGLYAGSQLLQYIQNLALDRQPLSHYSLINAIPSCISFFEVFSEKLIELVMGAERRAQLIIAVEFVKAASRLISLFTAKTPTMSINWFHDEDSQKCTLDLDHYIRHHSRVMNRQLHTVLKDMQLQTPSWSRRANTFNKLSDVNNTSVESLDSKYAVEEEAPVYVGRRSGLKLSASNTPVKATPGQSKSSSAKTDIAPYNQSRGREDDSLLEADSQGYVYNRKNGRDNNEEEEDEEETKSELPGDPRELSFGIAPDTLDEGDDESQFPSPLALVALGSLASSSSAGGSNTETTEHSNTATSDEQSPSASNVDVSVSPVALRTVTERSAATTPEQLDSDRDAEEDKLQQNPTESVFTADSSDKVSMNSSAFFSSPFEEPTKTDTVVPQSSSSAVVVEDVESVVLINQGVPASSGLPIVSWLQSTLSAVLTSPGSNANKSTLNACECKGACLSQQLCLQCTTPPRNARRASAGYSSSDVTPLTNAHKQAYSMSCMGGEGDEIYSRPGNFPQIYPESSGAKGSLYNSSSIPSSSSATLNSKHIVSTVADAAASVYQRSRQLHTIGWQAILASISATPEQCLLYGEVLYILRPAVYAWVKFGLRRKSNDVSSFGRDAEDDGDSDVTMRQFLASLASIWNPAENDDDGSLDLIALIVSLVIELLSIQLTSIGLELARAEARKQVQERDLDMAFLVEDLPPATTAQLHKFDTELRRRKTALFFYLVRSPVFNRTTQPFFRLLSQSVRSVPFVSTLPDSLLGALQYLNGSHFRSAASS